MLCSNMFGDILSDAAAALVGSIGLIPSASFGDRAPLFEPIHGSAPSLAGTDSANPIGSILSATMMLRDALGLSLEADWVEQSLTRVLSAGYRTPDIAEPKARDRKSTRLNSSHGYISYAVFCLKKKNSNPAVYYASL